MGGQLSIAYMGIDHTEIIMPKIFPTLQCDSRTHILQCPYPLVSILVCFGREFEGGLAGVQTERERTCSDEGQRYTGKDKQAEY